jgi:hypothetical protein
VLRGEPQLPSRPPQHHIETRERADNLYVREDVMLRGLAARITLDDGDAAGTTSTQDTLEFLRSNAMVVEIYGPTRWALTTRN